MFTTKAKLKKVALGLKPNSDVLMMFYSSPRYCTKPDVTGCPTSD
jgi:hypothetical protein